MMKGEDVSASGLDVFEQEQWRSLGLSNAAFVLKHGEQLQVHMDCMNALGEIVAIEDVDDMGGSCWTYIRVAVHGVEVPQHGAHPSTVAVGDTFLFSSHRSTLGTRLSTVLGTNGPASSLVTDRLLLQGDGCCITHPLPYYRCLIGAGAEEHSARRLLMCTKSTHLYVPFSPHSLPTAEARVSASNPVYTHMLFSGFRASGWGRLSTSLGPGR